MRIIIKLKVLHNTPQPVNQYHLQSAVYSIIRNSGNTGIHEREGYKYFNFSNLFPYIKGSDYKVNDEVKLIISSPLKELIYPIAGYMLEKPVIKIGKYNFEVINSKIVKSKLDKTVTLKAQTPIILSIYKYLYEKFNIKSDREYIYWTNKMPLNAFVEALTINSLNKYNTFSGKTIELNEPLFKSFKFLKYTQIDLLNGK